MPINGCRCATLLNDRDSRSDAPPIRPVRGDTLNLPPFDNICPSRNAPVLRRDGDRLALEMMTWGFPGRQADRRAAGDQRQEPVEPLLARRELIGGDAAADGRKQMRRFLRHAFALDLGSFTEARRGFEDDERWGERPKKVAR